jgi:hypothetical protein
MCTVSGWGATNAAGSQYPNDLRYADIQGLSDEDCKAMFDNMEPIQGVILDATSNFCAHTPEGSPNACFVMSHHKLINVAWLLF